MPTGIVIIGEWMRHAAHICTKAESSESEDLKQEYEGGIAAAGSLSEGKL
jgi:hypothetical protein